MSGLRMHSNDSFLVNRGASQASYVLCLCFFDCRNSEILWLNPGVVIVYDLQDFEYVLQATFNHNL